MAVVVWLIGLGLRPLVPVSMAAEVLSGAAIYACLITGLRLTSGQEVLALIAEGVWRTGQSNTLPSEL